MITPAEETYVLSKAYVPEHIVSLMALISKGEPFLVHDCLCFVKDDWAIVIGYPLSSVFNLQSFAALLEEVTSRFTPSFLSIAAPEIPEDYLTSSTETGHDAYYRLDVGAFKPRGSLVREVNKATEYLTVEQARTFTKEHATLTREFIKRVKPPDRIKNLYLSMAAYLAASETAMLLNARDAKGRLSAFYVIDRAAKEFATYVVGCYSRKHYAPHASDLLFHEMVKVAQESGKAYINLGLGVNDGIRRFKEKWGGVPFLSYTFCEWHRAQKNMPGLIESIMNAMKKL